MKSKLSTLPGKSILLPILIGIAGFAGAAITVNEKASLALAATALAVALILRDAKITIYILIIFGFSALPAQFPTWISLGRYGFYFMELLIVISLMWSISKPISSETKRVVTLLGTLLIAGSIVGAVSGESVIRVIGDIRPIIFTTLSIVIGAAVINAGMLKQVLYTIKWVLWASTAITLVASFTGAPLAGRTEVATLTIGDSNDATRYLTAATTLALVTACTCAALYVLKSAPGRTLLPFIIPSIIILLLAFSRTNILGVGVAALVALLAAFRLGIAVRGLSRIMSTIILVAVVTVAIISSSPLSTESDSWIGRQLGSYSARVIDGLSPDTLNSDSSTQYRVKENQELLEEVPNSPVIGHGFGFAYQEPSGRPGTFLHDRAPWYAHNFYLWLLVKAGFVGLLIFLYAVLTPIMRTLFRSNNLLAISLASTCVSLLVINIFAPIPLGTVNGPALGLLLGAVIALLEDRRGSTQMNLNSDKEFIQNR